MDGEREKFERTAACILIREFGSVSYDGAESDDEVFHIYESDEDGAEELKNFRELASELWQARASLPAAQPSDVVKAIEAISYCIKTIENHHIPEESNNIWSNGSTSRPHINLPILRTCLAALTTQQAQSVQPTDCEQRLYNKLRDTCIKTGIPLDILRKPIHPDVQKLVEAAENVVKFMYCENGEWGGVQRLTGQTLRDFVRTINALGIALAPFTANKE